MRLFLEIWVLVKTMLFSMVLTFSPLNWKLFLQETGSKPWFLLCFAASFTTFVMLILRETGLKPWFLQCFPATSPLFSHHYWRNLDALAKTYQKHMVFHRLVLILTLFWPYFDLNLTLIWCYFEVISKTSKNTWFFID